MAATERGMPLSHAHSKLDYTSVHRVKNDHRTSPPAFLRKGLLQLGRVLNAPFRCMPAVSLWCTNARIYSFLLTVVASAARA